MFDAAPPADTPLMQDPAFAAALRLCGQSPVTLPGGLMLLHRRLLGLPVAMLPRAAPPTDLADQLRAVGLHRVPLILSPERPHPQPRTLRLRGPQTFARLDLAPHTATRRAALHPKWRNQLSHAERASLRITEAPMPPDPTHPLLVSETAQARARGYANWPAALTAAFAAAAPQQTHLFTAHLHRRPVAHMLFLTHGARATYHIGHTTEAGKAANAHNLILWQATEWLASRGITNLDLGLIDARSPGLNRFKLRTGASQHITGGTWLHWHPLARLGGP
jgi:hypothetical protein